MAAFIPLPVIQKEAWAQCENPNCQKWRKLPPGATINEDEPWYCYMNPDFSRNTCSASEVEYDENVELVIDGAEDPEEAARNRAIMAELEASIAAAAAAAKGSRGRGRGRGRTRGSGRGRGRPPLPGAGRGVPPGRFGAMSAPLFEAPGGSRRGRSVSFAGDYDDDFGEDSDDNAGRSAARVSKRQVAKHLQRMLENQGQWEAPRGSMPAVPAALPTEAWEALAQTAPEAADVTCAAADLASSIRYFTGADEGAQGGPVAEIGMLARCSTILAAASGLVECQDALTKTERERLGLEDPMSLPEPSLPSNSANPGPSKGGPPAAVVPAPAPIPTQAPAAMMAPAMPQMATLPAAQVALGGMQVTAPQFMGMGLPGGINPMLAFAMLQQQMNPGNGPAS